MVVRVLFASFFMITTQAVAADDGVLVFGGTGRLGAPIVESLVADGQKVTVFARPSSSRARLDGVDVDYAIGDLLDIESVSAAFAERRYRVIIDATSRGSSRDSFYDTAMANMVQAASDRGVRQFILHGSIGAGRNSDRFPNARWDRMRDVLEAKGRAEALLIDSGIGYTIIRNGLVQVDGTPATQKAYLTEDTSVFGAVTRADLALLTMQCLDNSECMNKTLHAVDDSFPVPDRFKP